MPSRDFHAQVVSSSAALPGSRARTKRLASSPGHSQFLMIHAKNEKVWFAKSRAPHLGGRVIIVRGPVGDLFVVQVRGSACSAHSAGYGGIATDRRVAIAALQ